MISKPVIILSGPTASGKTSLSLEIANSLDDAVIINADSKQVFQEIPILSAQPTIEEMGEIPHKLFSCVSVAKQFSVMNWLEMAIREVNIAHESNKMPILVGGTGMYIKSLVHGISPIPDIDENIRRDIRDFVEHEGSDSLHNKLSDIDSEMASRLNPGDSQRVARAYEVIKSTGKSLLYWQKQSPNCFIEEGKCQHFFLNNNREQVYNNCNVRFDNMLDLGVMDEANNVMKMNLNPELPGMRAHGLPELIQYLNGDISLEQAIEWAKRNTRHYIKRQFTWFRGQMPEAIKISPGDDVVSYINSFLKL